MKAKIYVITKLIHEDYEFYSSEPMVFTDKATAFNEFKKICKCERNDAEINYGGYTMLEDYLENEETSEYGFVCEITDNSLFIYEDGDSVRNSVLVKIEEIELE